MRYNSQRVPSVVKDLRVCAAAPERRHTANTEDLQACAVASVSTERSGHLLGPRGHPATRRCTFSQVHVAVCRLCGPLFDPLRCDAFI